jgi:hypothetical protein
MIAALILSSALLEPCAEPLIRSALLEPCPEPVIRFTGLMTSRRGTKRNVLRLKSGDKIKDFELPPDTRVTINGHKNCTWRDLMVMSLGAKPSCKVTIARPNGKKIVTVVVTTVRPWNPEEFRHLIIPDR